MLARSFHCQSWASMRRFVPAIRNRLDLPVIDHALLIGLAALLLLGLSAEVRTGLIALAASVTALSP